MQLNIGFLYNFNSAGVRPSACAEASTPLHSRQYSFDVSNEKPRLVQQMLDHLDRAESLEIMGDHDRAQRERAMAEEYRGTCRNRTESKG